MRARRKNKRTSSTGPYYLSRRPKLETLEERHLLSGIDDGLVAHYKLDLESGQVVDVVGGYDGENFGATRGVPGVSGSAFRFDGVNDYATTSYGSGLTYPDGISIQAWVRSTGTGDGGIVISRDGWNFIGLNAGLGEGKPGMNLGLGSPASGAYTTVEYPESINDSKWHHLVGTYDGSQLSIYVDGDGVSKAAAGLAFTTDVFKIGWDDTNSYEPIRYFTGDIDDVRIWNRALSPGEIADLAAMNINEGLIAHYKLDEITGEVVDTVGSFHGANYGATRGAAGQIGNAFEFDGFNDHIDTLPANAIPTTKTISFWMNPTHTTPNGNQVFGSVQYAGGGKDGVILNYFHGCECVGTYYVEGNIDRGAVNSPNGSYPLNEWSLVTYTWDEANGVQLYSSGSLVASGHFDVPPSSHDRALMFGKSIQSQDLGFDGRLDDIRIWDRALSPAEVSLLFSSVYNVAPQATLSNDGPVDEGAVVTVTFSDASDPSMADTDAGFRYSWALDPADLPNAYAAAGTATTAEFVFDDDGMYTVYGRVYDDDDNYSQYSTAVTVNNVPPIATMFSVGSVNEGSTGWVSFSEQLDPSNADTMAGFTYSYDFDSDGFFELTEMPEPSVVVPQAYLNDGPAELTVTGRITDKDGGFSDFSTSISVDNVTPSIDDAVFTVVEHSPFGTIVGQIVGTDPGNDTLSYRIVAGTLQEAFTIHPVTGEISVFDSSLVDFETHSVLDLTVEVQDDDGAVDAAVVTIAVENLASITGAVFLDVNENGLYDADEPGIDDVTIELLDAANQPILDNDGLPLTALTSDGGYYQFEDLKPGTYLLHEIQPAGVQDGPEFVGSLGGTILVNDTIQLDLNSRDAVDYVFSELGQDVNNGDTAGIGFWQNRHGQQLIEAGGVALANWLSTSFGNVFGSAFAGDNATGGAVASFYRDQLFRQKSKKGAGPAKVDCQFMATALATFFTKRSLAGDIAADYGFNVTDTGVGMKVVDVGEYGDAFGVAHGTQLTVMELLLATNAMTDVPDNLSGAAYIYDLDGDGTIDEYEASLRRLANNVYALINGLGGTKY